MNLRTYFIAYLVLPLAIVGCSKSSAPRNQTMLNPVTYFEIPVTDLSRAKAFYSSVFLCDFETQNIDGNQMAVFAGSVDQPGIFGALALGSSYKPSVDGTRVYFNTNDIDATLDRVLAARGKIEYPKTSVPGVGHVAEFIDSEGNRIALHQPPQ